MRVDDIADKFGKRITGGEESPDILDKGEVSEGPVVQSIVDSTQLQAENELPRQLTMKKFEVGDIGSPEWDKAWEIYESSFPESERRNLADQTEVMKDPNYEFSAIMDLQTGEVLGFAGIWNLDIPGEKEPYKMIEHGASAKSLRNTGIWVRVFNELLPMNIVFEVDKPKNALGDVMREHNGKSAEELLEVEALRSAHSEAQYEELKAALRGEKTVETVLRIFGHDLNDEEFKNLTDSISRVAASNPQPIIEEEMKKVFLEFLVKAEETRRKRRIGASEKRWRKDGVGFKCNYEVDGQDPDYIQPPYGEGKPSVPLYICARNAKGGSFDSLEAFDKIRTAIHTVVYKRGEEEYRPGWKKDNKTRDLGEIGQEVA